MINPHYPPRMMSEVRGLNLTRGYHPTPVPTKQEPVDLEYEPREAFMPFHERTQRWAVGSLKNPLQDGS